MNARTDLVKDTCEHARLRFNNVTQICPMLKCNEGTPPENNTADGRSPANLRRQQFRVQFSIRS